MMLDLTLKPLGRTGVFQEKWMVLVGSTSLWSVVSIFKKEYLCFFWENNVKYWINQIVHQ